jgi:hypothetical protein
MKEFLLKLTNQSFLCREQNYSKKELNLRQTIIIIRAELSKKKRAFYIVQEVKTHTLVHLNTLCHCVTTSYE